MSVIVGVLLEEKERSLAMQSQYQKEISALPKGSIVKKVKRGRAYFYLTYRRGDKVVSDYVGKDAEQAAKLCQAIKKRKHLESIIKNLKSDLKLIEKAVK